MRGALLCLSAVILVVPAYGQTVSSGSAASHPVSGLASHRVTANSTSRGTKRTSYKPDIPVDTPIVTLDGVCAPRTKEAPRTAATCKTVLTRGQLEALQDAIDPEASPRGRQQFTITYARMLAAAQLAEQEHIDLNPEVVREIQVQQRLVRLQILTNALLQSLQRKALAAPASEIDAYYKKYEKNFEQAQVHRLAIPLNASTENGKPLDVAAAKAKLEELRSRVLAGDRFEDLQAIAYKDMGIKGDLPLTTLSIMHSEDLPLQGAKVFEMDLGETSEVFESDGVVVLLQVVSRRTLPLDEVRTQIQAVMFHQRLVDKLHDETKTVSAEFNLKYMESKTQPDLFPPTVLSQGGMRRGLLSTIHLEQ